MPLYCKRAVASSVTRPCSSARRVERRGRRKVKAATHQTLDPLGAQDDFDSCQRQAQSVKEYTRRRGDRRAHPVVLRYIHNRALDSSTRPFAFVFAASRLGM